MFWADDDGCYCSEESGWGAVCDWCAEASKAAVRRDNLEKENKRLRKLLSSPENRVNQYEMKLKLLKTQLETQQKTIQALRKTVNSYNKIQCYLGDLEYSIQEYKRLKDKVDES